MLCCVVLCCFVLCCAVLCGCSVLSSGDELVECSDVACPAGCVRDSNRPLLLSLLSTVGGADVVDLGIVRDDESSLSAVLSSSRLRSLDAVVCTGGVSMGELDLLKDWLGARGRLLFGRVNMKPGKPTTFAVLDRPADSGGGALPGLPFFALPGNPVSAFATCHLFVLPAMQSMRGVPASRLHPDSGYARCSVSVMGGVGRDSQRVDYHRCNVYFDSKRGGLVALSTGNQQSSRLMSATNANAMLVVQPGDTRVQHGETVEALLIDTVKAIDGKELSALVAQAAHGQAQQHAAHQSPLHSHTHHSHSHSHHGHGHRHSASSHGAAGGGSVVSPVSITVALVTVSDRVSSGRAQDGSGPAIEELLQQYSQQQPQSATRTDTQPQCIVQRPPACQHQCLLSLLLTVILCAVVYHCVSVQFVVCHRSVLADDFAAIGRLFVQLSDHPDSLTPPLPAPPQLALFTGGTGFSPRDVTADSLQALILRPAPGLVHLMLQHALTQSPLGPLTCLSRPVCGMRHSTLAVTLPGSPKAAVENLTPLLHVLPHACRLMRGERAQHAPEAVVTQH